MAEVALAMMVLVALLAAVSVRLVRRAHAAEEALARVEARRGRVRAEAGRALVDAATAARALLDGGERAPLIDLVDRLDWLAAQWNPAPASPSLPPPRALSAARRASGAVDVGEVVRGLAGPSPEAEDAALAEVEDVAVAAELDGDPAEPLPVEVHGDRARLLGGLRVLLWVLERDGRSHDLEVHRQGNEVLVAVRAGEGDVEPGSLAVRVGTEVARVHEGSLRVERRDGLPALVLALPAARV